MLAAILTTFATRLGVLAREPGTITTVGGNGTQGYAGDGGAATSSQLNTPCGIALDGDGNLFVADYDNHRVRMIAAVDGEYYGQSVEAGNIYTIAGNGTQGYSGDDGPATSASLNSPSGIALDSSRNLYIAEFWNHRVRKVDTSGGITTFAGTGEADYSGDEGPATDAKLHRPTDVACDASDNVYITDYYNHCIRMVSDTSDTLYGQSMMAGYIYTIAGTGTPGYSGDEGAPTAATLHGPQATRVDSLHQLLLIADTENHVIRVVPEEAGTYYGVSMTAGTSTPSQVRAQQATPTMGCRQPQQR